MNDTQPPSYNIQEYFVSTALSLDDGANYMQRQQLQLVK